MGKFYKCDLRDCEKLFSSKFSLKRHNLIHLNSKKHVCKHCQKAFVLPQYLEEHEYTHTGAKPFVCGINGCQEQFRQRGKLSIHKKNAHPDGRNDQNLAPVVGNGSGIEVQSISKPGKGRIQEDEEEKSDLLTINPINQSSNLIQTFKLQQQAGMSRNLINQLPQNQMFNNGVEQSMPNAPSQGLNVEQLQNCDRSLYSQNIPQVQSKLWSQVQQMSYNKPLQAKSYLPDFIQDGNLCLDNKQFTSNQAQQKSHTQDPSDIFNDVNKGRNSLQQMTTDQLQNIINSQGFNQRMSADEAKHQHSAFNIKQGAGDFTQSVVTKIQNLQNVRTNKDQQPMSSSIQQVSLGQPSMDQSQQSSSQQFAQGQKYLSNEVQSQRKFHNQEPYTMVRPDLKYAQQQDNLANFFSDKQMYQAMKEDSGKVLHQQILSQQMGKTHIFQDPMINRMPLSYSNTIGMTPINNRTTFQMQQYHKEEEPSDYYDEGEEDNDEGNDEDEQGYR